MTRGPKGEKRPADVIGNAVHVMRIATGEAEDNPRRHYQIRASMMRKNAVKAGVTRIPAANRGSNPSPSSAMVSE